MAARPPLVDRHEQCLANSHIVERLACVIGRQDVAAIPVTLLHGDFVAQFLDVLVAGRWGFAAEFKRGAVGTDRVDPCLLLRGVTATLEAVQVRMSGMVIVRIANAADRLSDLHALEPERPGAHDVAFVIMRVFFPADGARR